MEVKNTNVILIVEDEDAIRLTLRDYLRRKGYEVLVASDGVGAIKLLLDYSIDIILTDYRMDILGGRRIIKKKKKYCPEKAVIITSGFLRPDFDSPYEVVYKPFDYSELEIKVRDILASKKKDA